MDESRPLHLDASPQRRSWVYILWFLPLLAIVAVAGSFRNVWEGYWPLVAGVAVIGTSASIVIAQRGSASLGAICMLAGIVMVSAIAGANVSVGIASWGWVLTTIVGCCLLLTHILVIFWDYGYQRLKNAFAGRRSLGPRASALVAVGVMAAVLGRLAGSALPPAFNALMIAGVAWLLGGSCNVLLAFLIAREMRDLRGPRSVLVHR